MRKKVDVENWSRKKTYYTFSNYDDPYTGVVTKIDVTNLVEFSKEYNQSFYGIMIYFVLSSMNDIPAFKFGYGVESDKKYIFEYEDIAATATVIKQDNDLNFTRYIKFENNINDFLNNFNIAKNDAINGIDYYKIEVLDNMNKIYVTCLPWINFINFKDAINFSEKSSKPRLCWGKYYLKNERYFINLSLLVNHCFQDGYHMGMFFNIMQTKINGFNYKKLLEKSGVYAKRKQKDKNN